jgi:hypothetical protein
MADYLYSTVKHLAELGLHDEHSWTLQEMVAERIEAATARGPVSGLRKWPAPARCSSPSTPLGEIATSRGAAKTPDAICAG